MGTQEWRSEYPTWRLAPGVYLTKDKRWAEVKLSTGRWELIRLRDDGSRESFGEHADSETALHAAHKANLQED